MIEILDNSNRCSTDASNASNAAEHLILAANEIFSVISQLLVVSQTFQAEDGGLRLLLLCLAQPVLMMIGSKDLYSHGKPVLMQGCIR